MNRESDLGPGFLSNLSMNRPDRTIRLVATDLRLVGIVRPCLSARLLAHHHHRNQLLPVFARKDSVRYPPFRKNFAAATKVAVRSARAKKAQAVRFAVVHTDCNVKPLDGVSKGGEPPL